MDEKASRTQYFKIGRMKIVGYISIKVKVTQSCLTLATPMGYTLHGILQARILEWVAIPFSRGSSQPRSPTLQADCLPAEPQEKSPGKIY